MVRLLSLGLAAAVASTASATLTNTIVQVNATSSELTGAGFSQVGSGPFVSYQAGECAVNGCFTLAGTTAASLPAKGFMQFQFQSLRLLLRSPNLFRWTSAGAPCAYSS